MKIKKIKEKFSFFWNTKLTKRMKKTTSIVLGVLICLVSGAYVLSQQLLYTDVNVTATYTSIGATSSQYELFASGLLRYGRDGAAYIDFEGVEIWNQAYQISTPIIEITNGCAVVADSGGNSIVVFDEEGLKGEIQTTLPIEKVSVSEQGIVAVLTKDVETPRIMCYDAVGNLLVEHKPASSVTGYPVDVSLSLDGKLMLVTYVQIVGGEIVSNYIYYSFDEMVNTDTNNVVSEGRIAGVVIPETYFVNEDTSVMVSDQGFMIYTGTDMPQILCSVSLISEIDMTFHSDQYIGFVLEGTGEYDKELQVYNLEGELVTDLGFDGKYESVDIIGSEVILYEETECRIFKLTGIERFQGEMTMELKGVFPTFGINSYIIIGNEGIKKVQLTR